jgi:hypothetical protein
VHKRAFIAFSDLLGTNQLRRVFTITKKYMPKMFGALTPWSGKPQDILGVVVKEGAMHFYQMLPYVNKEDPHEAQVPLLDEIRNVQFPDDSPEGLYQDVTHAVSKLAHAKQAKFLFEMDSEGFEELLPSNDQPWKTVVVTESKDGGIVFHELTDHVLKVKRTRKAKQVAGNTDDGKSDDSGGVKEPVV